MKYSPKICPVPAEQRAAINEKILRLVADQRVAPPDVFACYTGLGKLHGLQREDYQSYHDYSEAKKLFELGQFFTPPALCEEIVKRLEIGPRDLVADLSCGSGNFFNALPNEANAYGCELEARACRVARYLYPEAHIEQMDMQHYAPGVYFDYVVGNPPYNFWASYRAEKVSSQLFYCMKAAALLKPGGLLALVVPGSFLNDDFLCKSDIERINEHFDYITGTNLPTTSFRAVGIERIATKLMFFRKRSPHLLRQPYVVEHPELSWQDLSERLSPALRERNRAVSKLTLELARQSAQSQHYPRIRKYLYEINAHPRLQAHYPRAHALVHDLNHQRQPAGMTVTEWEEKRLTPERVGNILRSIVSRQNQIPRDETRLVRTAAGFRFKGYNAARREALAANERNRCYSWADLVRGEGEVPAPYQTDEYRRVVRRRKQQFTRQSTPFEDLARNETIDRFLSSFKFLDKHNRPGRYTDVQHQDIGLVLQKRYAQLNWEMGAGKTLAGYGWASYRKQFNKVRNVYICSAAIAIHMTWEPFMKQHRERYVKVNRISDFEAIQAGDYVLLTAEMTIRYQRQIKSHLKQISRKAALVFDESDQITNHRTRLNQAMQRCFGRLPYKLNTTGTSTRNHINELYPQLRLLYNNSVNMLCTAPRVYQEATKKRDGKKIVATYNERVGEPFPAQAGQALFKACFCPMRATVFGIEKENQDIRQEEHLRPLIRKTIITRRFTEIAGDRYTIKSHRIDQNGYERQVYRQVMEEFSTLVNHYFSSTGSHEKDAMLRIIRQIQLLIRACSVPHTFREYQGGSIPPAKFDYIASLLSDCSGQVLLGSTTVEGAKAYYQYLSERFPFRSVYLITGATSFTKRRRIVAQFEGGNQAILVASQQSLSSSLSIRICQDVILESLQWNIPRMSQFYFRAIRFDNLYPVRVHFVTYHRSIEQNLLALLMSKERLNEYIKTLELAEREDVFGNFDIDLSLLSSLIKKEYDEQGSVRLTWGDQEVE